jgi:hypothetical protein
MPVLETLVPPTQFKVLKLESARVQVDKYRYILKDGWGLWDTAAQAWVASPEVIAGNTVVVPWAFARKNVAQRAVKDGLYLGYNLWVPG